MCATAHVCACGTCRKKIKKYPGSAIITCRSPSQRHQEEEITDKTKQVQIEEMYKKH